VADAPQRSRLTAVLVQRLDERAIETTLHELGIARGRSVMIVVGGAAGLDVNLEPALARLFTDAILPAAQRCDATIVDGGTDSGVMRIAGAARRSLRSDVPLVGVVAEGTTTWGGSDEHDAAPLEPNHTQVVLVPGRTWGDESRWIPLIAAAIADGAPQLAVVIGGGDVTRQDVRNIGATSTPIVAVRGTGGVADALAVLADSSRVIAVDALSAPEVLLDRLITELTTGGRLDESGDQ
jgi:SLOG in TRPM, prokaryote